MVRSHLSLGNSVKKLFKTQDFQKFMKGDVRVPYRDLHPSAPESEWKRKGTNQEKSVRVVKLLDVNVEADSVFHVKVSSDWLTFFILTSDWSIPTILTSDWSIPIILTSDWSIPTIL